MNLNFLLTEISVQLLDNTFFDINGQQTDNMKDLFSAQKVSQNSNNGQKRAEQRNDLLPLLGVESFEELLSDTHKYVESQYQGFKGNLQSRIDAMPQTEESFATSRQTRAQIQSELCEVRIRTQREYAKIINHSKKMMDIYLDTLPSDADRDQEAMKYTEEERNLLVNEYNSLLFMLKYILADVTDRTECEQILQIIDGAKETIQHL